MPKVIARGRGNGIQDFWWQQDSRHVLFLQDHAGDEAYHLYQSDLFGHSRDLTPFQNVQARLIKLSHRHPQEALIALNRRNSKWHDVYRVNLRSGAMALGMLNPGNATDFFADDDLNVLVYVTKSEEGNTELWSRASNESPWQLARAWDFQEIFTGVPAIAPDHKSFYVLASDTHNSVHLWSVDFRSHAAIELQGDDEYDIDATSINPVTGKVDAVRFSRGRNEWRSLNERMAVHLARLAAYCGDGDFDILSRGVADRAWMIRCTFDTRSRTFAIYDAADNSGRPAFTYLFSERPELDRYELSPMTPISFQARDGLTVHGYLSLPTGEEHEAPPMVLVVHGGPWARDSWGYRADVQLLTNRGYAVMLVNFRGSAGYGRRFLNAGNREWGGRMEDDLIDAKRWAVEQGYTTSDRVAIMGGSYGGYATLAALAYHPTEFACGVDMAGPSDLNALYRSYPPYWAAMRRDFAMRVGNDSEFLNSRSPLFTASQIVRPLLVAQSRNDPRVTQEQADRIVRQIRSHGGTVEYILFADEGHSLAKAEDRVFLLSRIELFLGRCLGGPTQNTTQDAVPADVSTE